METFTEHDPAERRALNRLFYRNRRPTWLGHWVSQFFCWWARVGLTPAGLVVDVAQIVVHEDLEADAAAGGCGKRPVVERVRL